MRTPNQIEASRANGAQSRGPVTAGGKLRVAQNAIKHGLTAKTVVLSNEDPAAFQALLQSFLDRFQPAGDVEFLHVEEMVACQWRLRRVWSLQTALEELQMSRDFEAVERQINGADEPTRCAIAAENLAKSPAMENLRRHEERLSRLYQRAYKMLKELQASHTQPEEAVARSGALRPAPANSQNKPEPVAAQPAALVVIHPPSGDEKEKPPCIGPSEPV